MHKWNMKTCDTYPTLETLVWEFVSGSANSII